MLIGFTHKTSKILPRLFCRRFRHCAVVIRNKEKGIRNKYVMYQAGKGPIELIHLNKRDLKILEQHGWIFVEIKRNLIPFSLFLFPYLTCVGFAKRALGIRNPFIWTPDQLYRKIGKRKQKKQNFLFSNFYFLFLSHKSALFQKDLKSSSTIPIPQA